MDQKFLKIGTVSKTHGHKGDVVLHCGLFESENLKEITWVFIDLNPEKVPFKVLETRVLDEKKLLVKLNFIDDIDDASKLLKCDFYVLEEEVDSDNSDVEAYIIGFKVFNAENEYRGDVVDVLENKMQTLLEVKYEGGNYLLPFDYSFLLGFDKRKKQIMLDFSDDLISL